LEAVALMPEEQRPEMSIRVCGHFFTYYGDSRGKRRLTEYRPKPKRKLKAKS
jgi:hypothetical protein